MGVMHVPSHVLRRVALLFTLALGGGALCLGMGCGEKETVVDTSTASSTTDTAKVERRICPKCGRQYFKGELFCIYDRTQLVAADTIKAQQKVCPVCGRTYPPSKNFCVIDGNALVDVVEEQGMVADQGTASATPQGSADTSSTTTSSVNRPGDTHTRETVARGPEQTLPSRTYTSSSSSTEPDTRVASTKPVVPHTYTTSSSTRPTSTTHHAAATPRSSTTYSTTSSSSSSSSSRSTYTTTYTRPTPRPTRYVPPPTPIPHRPTPVPPRPTPIPVRATPVPPPPPPPVIATPAPVAVAKIEPPADTGTSQVVPARSADELFADFEAVSARASQGKLSASDVAALEAVTMSDPNFTRSRALLAMNYKNRDQEKYYRALTELMRLPENKYNPMYNLELAEYYLLTKKYAKSTQQAKLVDRYKQRFPRSVYFQSVARMYEVQAKAYEGQFNLTEDPEFLDRAISIWKRYINHVSKKDQTDRVRMAQDYITKLEKIKRRLE